MQDRRARAPSSTRSASARASSEDRYHGVWGAVHRVHALDAGDDGLAGAHVALADGRGQVRGVP